jgi:hypothetical protein
LLECAKLGRVVLRQPPRGNGELQVHVVERGPIVARHPFHAGTAADRIERRPLELGAIRVQRSVTPRIASTICLDEARVERVDACLGIVG